MPHFVADVLTGSRRHWERMQREYYVSHFKFSHILLASSYFSLCLSFSLGVSCLSRPVALFEMLLTHYTHAKQCHTPTHMNTYHNFSFRVSFNSRKKILPRVVSDAQHFKWLWHGSPLFASRAEQQLRKLKLINLCPS